MKWSAVMDEAGYGCRFKCKEWGDRNMSVVVCPPFPYRETDDGCQIYIAMLEVDGVIYDWDDNGPDMACDDWERVR